MGGHSGGGGGGSGTVDYPEYMKTQHQSWLSALASAINNASSPFTTAAAFDPTITELPTMRTAALELESAVNALSEQTDFSSDLAAVATAIDNHLVVDDEIMDNIAAFAAQLDEQIEDTVLPRFKAGMRDIGAVMSSTFVMGQARIYDGRTRDITKYGTDLKVAAKTQRDKFVMAAAEYVGQNRFKKIELLNVAEHMIIETERLAIVAQQEQIDQDINYDEADARWDLEIYQYGANMLAGIGGGTTGVTSPGKSLSKTGSAIGGAMSGAAVGASIGASLAGSTIAGTEIGANAGPWGAAIGAVAGLVYGMFAS